MFAVCTDLLGIHGIAAEMQLTFHFESELTGGRESSELISSHLHIFYLNF